MTFLTIKRVIFLIVNPDVLYFHVENKEKYLDEYQVIAVNQKEVLRLFLDEYKGKLLRFSYKGYVQELKL